MGRLVRQGHLRKALTLFTFVFSYIGVHGLALARPGPDKGLGPAPMSRKQYNFNLSAHATEAVNSSSPSTALPSSAHYYKPPALSAYLNLDYQLLRFMALIRQPGIITPTQIERTMQVAYNAKLNSGCISRQVGAVVTDAKFSIKAIGWNDVPAGQTPCNLRV